MKKLTILLALLAIALVGYSQATPGKIVRVAARTTTFDTNLPAGTMIYCIEDSTNWNVKAAGVASTRSINTAWAAKEIEFIRTTVQTTRDNDQVNLIVDSLKASEHTVTIDSATTTNAGVMTAAMVTKLAGVTAGSGQFYAQSIESPADSTAGSIITMDYAPKDTTSIVLELNGQTLVRSVDYFCANAIAKKELLVKNAFYKYDQFHYSITK